MPPRHPPSLSGEGGAVAPPQFTENSHFLPHKVNLHPVISIYIKI